MTLLLLPCCLPAKCRRYAYYHVNIYHYKPFNVHYKLFNAASADICTITVAPDLVDANLEYLEYIRRCLFKIHKDNEMKGFALETVYLSDESNNELDLADKVPDNTVLGMSIMNMISSIVLKVRGVVSMVSMLNTI